VSVRWVFNATTLKHFVCVAIAALFLSLAIPVSQGIGQGYDYVHDGQCLTPCPQGTILHEAQCLSACPESLIEVNNQCLGSCPNGSAISGLFRGQFT